jgi:hypothetical protein
MMNKTVKTVIAIVVIILAITFAVSKSAKYVRKPPKGQGPMPGMAGGMQMPGMPPGGQLPAEVPPAEGSTP